MEMIKYFIFISIVSIITSCSNTYELETGEIKTLSLLKESLSAANKKEEFFDARQLINRKQIDDAKMPVLFVELETGQNGTLTPYPGKGIGQTWLGADGATITFERGILIASRGMGNDVMGGSFNLPIWSSLDNSTNFERELGYLNGNNQISYKKFACTIVKDKKTQIINIWEVDFKVNKFTETCTGIDGEIQSTFYVDKLNIVRKSFQYHGGATDYIITERLDR